MTEAGHDVSDARRTLSVTPEIRLKDPGAASSLRGAAGAVQSEIKSGVAAAVKIVKPDGQEADANATKKDV